LEIKGDSYFSLSSPLPDETIKKLIDRNSRLVDLGLARLVNDEFIELILEKYPNDNEVLTAALSNRVAVAGLYSPSQWLKKRVGVIGVEGIGEQLEALFTNPQLPDEIFIQVLNKIDWCENIPEDQYQQILWNLLSNPKISEEPKDDIDFDSSQHRIISACWGLLLKLEPTRTNADLLAYKIDKFQELELPYEFTKSLNLNEDLDWKEKAKLSNTAFLKLVFESWKAPSEEETEYYDPWGTVRKVTVQKFNQLYLLDLKKIILEDKDSYQVQGFFSAFHTYNFEKITKGFDGFYSSYGRDCLIGFIENEDTYRKQNKVFGKKFYETMTGFQEDPEIDRYESLRFKYNSKLEYLNTQPNPERFITDSSDLYEEYEKDDEENLFDLNQKLEEIQKKLLDNNSNNSNSVNQQFNNLSDLIFVLSKKIDLLTTKSEGSSNSFTQQINQIKSTKDLSSLPWIYILIGVFVGYLVGKG
jgi:hypothetical protein